MKFLSCKNFLLILLLLTISSIQAQLNTISLSLNVQEKSILDVINKISSQTDYTFVYDPSEFDVTKIVSINVENKSLENILQELVSDQKLFFRTKNNAIIISKVKGAMPGQSTPVNQSSNSVLKTEKITLSGQVLDDFKQTMPGVNVIIEGTVIGTITDYDGKFSITTSGKNIGRNLTFSAIGYMKQSKPIEGTKTYAIKLVEETVGIDEVVVVAFGEQKRESMMASIESVKMSELKIPTSNLTTGLGGRVSGLMSFQRTGEPGEDNAQFFIRGATTFGYASQPLYLIDGIEMTASDLSRLNPDDIESFNVMKDAVATSLYGARGANGVIFVTTKKGVQGDTKVSVRMETSLSRPTTEVELADPISYMRLYNEAITTRNPYSPTKFSERKIAATQRGDNPILYPNVDWQDELFKNYSINNRINMNISGGGSKANYYVSVAYTNDNGILKEVGESNFNNNISLQKYTVRSNVNVEIFPNTKLSTKFQVDIDDYTGPMEGGSDIYKRVMKTSPVAFRPYYDKPSSLSYLNHVLFGHDPQDPSIPNPYADMVRGYKDYEKTNLLGKIDLEYTFQGALKGLKFLSTVSSTRYSSYDVKRAYEPFYYSPVYNEERDEISYAYNSRLGGEEFLSYEPGKKEITTRNYFESRLTYNKVFDKKHDLNLLAVGYANEYKVANPDGDSNGERLIISLPSRNIGLSGRIAYTYDLRYAAELTFGYNGSERFSKDKRFGFFPAFGFAWNIHNESFMKPYQHIFTKAKLKATYGIIGQDNIGEAKDRFFYLSQVNLSDGFTYRFGETFREIGRKVSIGREGNTEITWEKSYKYDFGMELKLFKDLEFKLNYFGENREDIFEYRISPVAIGAQTDKALAANTGEAKSWGWDGSIVYNKSFFNGLWIQGRANLTITDHEITKAEEPDYDFLNSPWKSSVGYRINQPRGLIAERLFVDAADVASSPEQTFGKYGAGDIKYKDVNNDGKISDLDQVPIGFPTNALIQYGFGISFGTSDWDISMFFQGSAQESFWLDLKAVTPFVENNQLLKVWSDDHWSEQNRNPYAKWPRLSTTSIENNTQQSTWFMHDASYLRLKSVELGYNLPSSVIESFYLTKFRVYTSGSNLYTWSSFDLWDPEMGANAFAYPLQQVFNLGIQVQF